MPWNSSKRNKCFFLRRSNTVLLTLFICVEIGNQNMLNTYVMYQYYKSHRIIWLLCSSWRHISACESMLSRWVWGAHVRCWHLLVTAHVDQCSVSWHCSVEQHHHHHCPGTDEILCHHCNDTWLSCQWSFHIGINSNMSSYKVRVRLQDLVLILRLFLYFENFYEEKF